ncbi:MAG TPA: TauD/TfdA family dioxygenase [Stellaceae bacterium]|nr:TauD/TfdA family dioxygenase [Stellaceae bacterium]
MSSDLELVRPLPNAGFGGTVRLVGNSSAQAVVEAAEADPELLPRALAESSGLLLLPGMGAIRDQPELLLRLSRLFGSEVEDYRETLTPLNFVHEAVPEIFVVSNIPPAFRAPPAMPEPRLTEDGKLPVQFPQRRGWHTDQSYRRPPPDISLFFAAIPAPQGQAQTMFADGTAAYEALPADLKARVDGLMGLHISPRVGRSYPKLLAGETPLPLRPNEQPQAQPIVRTHPVTGKRALYMCEYGQMDWLEGPIVGMPPGPKSEAGELLFTLMSHATQRQFVYVHEWSEGDLVVWDNRCLMHTATWYDAEHQKRLMWRTTVSGNPGPAYAGEKKSWILEAAE